MKFRENINYVATGLRELLESMAFVKRDGTDESNRRPMFSSLSKSANCYCSLLDPAGHNKDDQVI